MDELCSACLCIGRETTEIEKSGIFQMYVEILDENPLNVKNLKMQICWECKALMHKYERFKKNVQECYQDLLHCSQECLGTKLTPRCPHLRCFQLESIDLNPHINKYPDNSHNKYECKFINPFNDTETERPIFNTGVTQNIKIEIEVDDDNNKESYEEESVHKEDTFDEQCTDFENDSNNELDNDKQFADENSYLNKDSMELKGKCRMYAGVNVFLNEEETLNEYDNCNKVEIDIDIVKPIDKHRKYVEIDVCNNEALNEKDDSSTDEREIIETDNKHNKCENMDLVIDETKTTENNSNNNNDEEEKIKPKRKRGKKVKNETLEEESGIRKYANVDVYSEPQEDMVFPELNFTKVNRSKIHSSLDMNTKSNIVALHKMGRNITEISRELGISRNTVRIWVQRYNTEGSLEIRPPKARKKSFLSDSQKQLIFNQYEKFGYVSTKNFAELFGSSSRTIRNVLNQYSGINTATKKRKKTEPKRPVGVSFKSFECGYCGKIFKNKAKLAEHIAAQHTSNPRLWDCPHCPAQFKYNSTKFNHVRICHRDKMDQSLYCAECKRQFTSKFAFQRHAFVKHAPQTEYIFKCDDCDQKFVDKKNLREHMIGEHSKYYTYKCNLCPEEFECRKSLRTHKTVTHSKKKILCHLCAVQFKEQFELLRHIRDVHNNGINNNEQATQ